MKKQNKKNFSSFSVAKNCRHEGVPLNLLLVIRTNNTQGTDITNNKSNLYVDQVV